MPRTDETTTSLLKFNQLSQPAKKPLQTDTVQMQRILLTGYLAQGLVHDLGNPLTTILLNLDTLEKSAPPESLRLIKGASQRIKTLVTCAQKLLATDLYPESTPVNQIINDASTLFDYHCKKFKIKLIAKKTKEPVFTSGCPNLLFQIICLKLSNGVLASSFQTDTDKNVSVSLTKNCKRASLCFKYPNINQFFLDDQSPYLHFQKIYSQRQRLCLSLINQFPDVDLSQNEHQFQIHTKIVLPLRITNPT